MEKNKRNRASTGVLLLAALLTPIKTGRHFIVAISVWLIEICWPLFGVNKNTNTRRWAVGGLTSSRSGLAGPHTPTHPQNPVKVSHKLCPFGFYGNLL